MSTAVTTITVEDINKAAIRLKDVAIHTPLMLNVNLSERYGANICDAPIECKNWLPTATNSIQAHRNEANRAPQCPAQRTDPTHLAADGGSDSDSQPAPAPPVAAPHREIARC